MKRIFVGVIIGLFLTSISYGAPAKNAVKTRLLVVSSYHKEYAWTQETNSGFCAAMLELGYFDKEEQTAGFTRNDYIETSTAIIKKIWMDTKRKKSKKERVEMTFSITQIAKEFKPDLIFLGDDNAAKYIGNEFLDSDIPIVFWGVNNTPVKYGLVDNAEKPGHNVTGVYQSGYYTEGLELIKSIIPGARTFAVLSDGTSSGRSHFKKIEYLARKDALPLKLVEVVSTSDYELWKKKALELQKKVDAFFLAQYSGLQEKNGNNVSAEKAAKWYLTHINIPEAAVQGQFVKQGMMCSADDAGYNQGFEAAVIAHDILANKAIPATYPPRSPKRGSLMVNRQRAGMLGIKLTEDMGIEEYIEEASALQAATGKKGGKQ